MRILPDTLVRARLSPRVARVPILVLATWMTIADSTLAAEDPAIPAGQEELLAVMLGKGAALPGDCKFAGGHAEFRLVQAVYDCPAGEVAFQLTHPSRAGPTAVLTSKFALTLQRGSPSDTLTDALVDLIRSREDSFDWGPVGTTQPERTDRGNSASDRESLAAHWNQYSPNPYVSVPLVGLVGWLYRAYVVVAMAFFLLPPLFAPWCGHRAVAVESWRHRTLVAVTTGFGLLAIAATAVWFSYDTTINIRSITEEHELPIMFADFCAQGRGCPLAGQQVSTAGVHLGPIYFVILTVCRLLTRDLDVAFGVILGAHAVAAAITALLGNRLYGNPWGYLAGLFVALSPSLAGMFFYLTHVNFIPLPMVGFIGALLYQAREGGNRPFVVAASSLAVATQLHAIAAVFIPSLLLTAWWSCPRPSRRGWFAAGAVWLLLYAPWIIYNIQLDFRDFGRASLEGWPGESQPFLEAWIAPPWLLLGLPLLTLGIDAWRTPHADRAVARALLLTLVLPITAFLCLPTWRWQYTAPFLMVLPFVWIHTLRAPLTWVRLLARRPLVSGVLASLICVAVTWVLVQDLRGRQEPMLLGPPVWREERAIVRDLERRSLRADDMTTRVGGARWPGFTAYPGILAQRSAPPAQSLGPRDRVLIVENCLELPPNFAAWQEVVAPLGRPYLLGGYRSHLTPVKAYLVDDRTTLWSGNASLPIFVPSARNTIRHALEGTRLSEDSLALRLQVAWLQPADSELRLQTTLLPENDDRVVVVAHDKGTSVTAEIDGARAKPFGVILNSNEILHERFLIEGARRNHEVPIRILVRRKDSTFPFINVYEEPHPRCLRPPD